MGLYKTVYKTAYAEIEVKKSKFLAEVRHVETNEEALGAIKECKKKYYDATHNCSAYILKGDGGLRHSSDDGEPSGTAGKPILDVLGGLGLSDVLVVVTRYFGGTLLGTGGLVRAYSGAAKAVLEEADIVEHAEAFLVELDLEYALHPKILHLCKEFSVVVYQTDYAQLVGLRLLVAPESYESFFREVAEITAGAISGSPIENRKKVLYYKNKIGEITLI